MRTGSTLMRVVESPGGGRDIREPGSIRAVDHRADMNEAVIKAEEFEAQVEQTLGFMRETVEYFRARGYLPAA